MYREDKQILSGKKWLNDRIINASQKLLKKQSGGEIEGFQSTLYAEMPSRYQPVKGQQVFVQIINIHRNHWIVVSNFGCSEGTLNIYDSLYPIYIKSTNKKTDMFILEVTN